MLSGFGPSVPHRLQPMKGLYRVTTSVRHPNLRGPEGQLLVVNILFIAPKLTHPLSDDLAVPDWAQFPLLEVDSSEPLIDQLEVEEGEDEDEELASDLKDTDTSVYDEPFASKAKGSSSSKVKASKSRGSLLSKKIIASKGKHRRSSQSNCFGSTRGQVFSQWKNRPRGPFLYQGDSGAKYVRCQKVQENTETGANDKQRI
ncbi:hypothetical protein GG344DRAFT_71379 [Lentinula edodes]|nr:hypothetical protein GG344DRAFT_71379 [Lentinula edodes]